MRPLAHADQVDNPDIRRVPRLELIVAMTLLAAAIGLRIFYALRAPIDSDEPQHLHVVWGWTQGLLQYRDVFDNHTPLFHMLWAPLAAAVGEQPHLLVIMRLAMVPLWMACLVCVYWIGAMLFSRGVGVWSAVLLALLPPFFLCSLQFRTDDLWAVVWLCSLAVLLGPSLTVRRGVLAGVLMGTTMGVSLKTTFLLSALAAAAVATPLILRLVKRGSPWPPGRRHPVQVILSFAGGMLVVPLALVAYFYARGAIGPFYYGTIQHNFVPDLYHLATRRVIFALLALLGTGVWAWAEIKVSGADALASRRVMLMILLGTLLCALSFWPVVPKQDYLPIYPVLMVLAAAAVGHTGPRVAARWELAVQKSVLFPASVIAAAVQLSLLVIWAPRHDGTASGTEMWRQVLRLTDSGQLVMDLKGELLFRPRAYYYVLESVTGKRMKIGLLPDTIPERLIETRTCVASKFERTLPPRAREFIRRNYISVGQLLVAGKFLPLATGSEALAFDVLIPARYALMVPSGTARGMLDGRSYDGPLALQAGSHVYKPQPEEGRVALVWAQAKERGFSPFERPTPGVEP